MSRPVTTRVWLLAVFAVAMMVSCAREETRSQDGFGTTDHAAGAVDATAPAESANAPRIVFLGDSLTAGLGIAKEEAVPALIQQRLRSEGYAYEVVNAGNSGDTSDGGLSRLNWSLSGDVRILVVELGANDGLRGIPPERTRQNLETIVHTAKQRGIKVLLTGMEAPPNYGVTYTNRFRATFKDVATSEQVAFMPFFLDGVAGLPALNQPDGVHPTPEGARIIAGNLWRYLQPLLEKTSS